MVIKKNLYGTGIKMDNKQKYFFKVRLVMWMLFPLLLLLSAFVYIMISLWMILIYLPLKTLATLVFVYCDVCNYEEPKWIDYFLNNEKLI